MSSRSKRKRMDRLFEMQAGQCAFCGLVMATPNSVRERIASDGHWCGDLDPSLEHVVPRSRGGSNALTNLLLAHRICNETRGNDELPERARLVWKANLRVLSESELSAA